MHRSAANYIISRRSIMRMKVRVAARMMIIENWLYKSSRLAIFRIFRDMKNIFAIAAGRAYFIILLINRDV
jgi:hypothetical protein